MKSETAGQIPNCVFRVLAEGPLRVLEFVSVFSHVEGLFFRVLEFGVLILRAVGPLIVLELYGFESFRVWVNVLAGRKPA